MAGPEQDTLQAILGELRSLNRNVERIAGALDGRREIDPGDAVPEGVAPLSPVPTTPEDEQVRRALEALPRRER